MRERGELHFSRNFHVRCPTIRGMAHDDREIGSFDYGTEPIIGALIEVHRCLGPGLLESAYEACLCRELSLRGIRFARQTPLPVEYKGHLVDCGYRLDVVVDDRIVVELKSVDRLLPIHAAQLVTYLRLAQLPVGLLVNFNVFTLKMGLRRLTPHYQKPSRSPDLPVHSRSLFIPEKVTGRSEDWEP